MNKTGPNTLLLEKIIHTNVLLTEEVYNTGLDMQDDAIRLKLVTSLW